jgi:FlgD Ig-like domain
MTPGRALFPFLARPPFRLALLLLAALLGAGAVRARADEPEQRSPELAAHVRALKQIEIAQLREGATRRMANAQREAREARRRKHAAGARRGSHARPATDEEGPVPADIAPAPFRTNATLLGPPNNVRANNPVGDAAGVGQAEEAIAGLGDNVIAVWNDGQGYISGGDTQGFAWSVDGGRTFTDAGSIIHPAAFPTWIWTSDPSVAVNEKTGRFYYCGLANSDASHNAIGVAIGHFAGATFAWDTAYVVRNVLTSTFVLDKPWFTADSLHNGAYVSNTTFIGTATRIDYARSLDGGRTWSAPTQLSDPAEVSGVQGSRVAVGPTGDVYLVWESIGVIDVDHFYGRRSPDGDPTKFSARAQVASFYANFGTGGPGYNRNHGVHFPSLTVDRTLSPNRGRAYVVWNESYDWFDDLLDINFAQAEVEPNNFAAQARPFTVGNTLRGSLSSGTDADWWSFPLTAGDRLIVYADSLADKMTYALRLFAPSPDSAQRLCFGGDADTSNGLQYTTFTFVAPASGTYLLRIGGATAASVAGSYRILTGLGQHGNERGRDQRDVFVSWTDNGASWATPVRVNDSPVGYDDWLPEVTVGGDGYPYVLWRDHRGDPYGSRTSEYVARSINGGVTWGASLPLSTASGNFSAALSNIQPNEGDYNSLSSDARALHAAWADGRAPTVDVYTAVIDMRHEFHGEPLPPPVAPGSMQPLTWTLANLNRLFSNNFTWTITSARSWPMPAGGLVSLASGAEGTIHMEITVPDTAKVGRNTLTLRVANAKGTLTLTTPIVFTVYASLVDAGPRQGAEFALWPAVPNPAASAARLAFNLPTPGHVTLRIYGLAGELVRTLVDGGRASGAQSVMWDGRDDGGRPVATGAYFYRLEGPGGAATRRLVWMR